LKVANQCQSPVHNPGFKLDLFANVRLNSSLVVHWCSDCMNLIHPQAGSDPTMKIFHIWAAECGPTPVLPKSLKDNSLKQASLVQYVNVEVLSKHRTNINKDFPSYLRREREKENFIQGLEEDEMLSNFLPDVNKGSERKNIALRLWSGCMDGAKTTRDKFVSGGTEIRLAPDDRREADILIRQEGLTDPIYMSGVEAALFFELVENKHSERYLEGIPLDSAVRRYLKEDSKNKSTVTRNDLV
jgi:hypothetical protein